MASPADRARLKKMAAEQHKAKADAAKPKPILKPIAPPPSQKKEHPKFRLPHKACFFATFDGVAKTWKVALTCGDVFMEKTGGSIHVTIKKLGRQFQKDHLTLCDNEVKIDPVKQVKPPE